ncbi:hypothetical protein [Pseudonocardia sp.]|uniref:hypothetical protein n=1 Tax=Pseudonocardia sp. TaxID=60912 RepID=UPI003D1118F6
MRRSIRALAAFLAGAALLAAGCAAAPPAPAPPPSADVLLAALPGPEAEPLPGFVGTDVAGVPLAVVEVAGGAVAYLCDGAGVGKWFTGSVDGGRFALAARDGTTLVATVEGATLRGELGGVAFALPSSTRGGLLRSTFPLDGTTFAAGWIVGDDGAVHGRTVDESGKGVGVASAADDAPGNTQDVSVSGPPDGEPVPTGLLGNAQCGILLTRLVFNQRQGREAQAAGDQEALDDALADIDVIKAKQRRAGCEV